MVSNRPPSVDARNTRKVVVFALVCVATLTAVALYAWTTRARRHLPDTKAVAPPLDPARLAELRREPHILFRITADTAFYGHVGVVAASAPASAPLVTTLTCDRVHASATRGLCLFADRGVLTTYRAIAFDDRLVERQSFRLPGAPSRTRVALSGPFAASTVFVSGDSYASSGFSTRTNIYELGAGSILGDLETFTVLQDGKPFKRADFNFWGVTFTREGDEFYATLGTGGALHFVRGSISARRMIVVAPDVECPSLSPDGTRVVYKSRITEGASVMWRVRVRRLDTAEVVTLQESRSVDDQAEWLDDHHILYSLPRQGTGSSDVWAVPADGTGAPKVFIPGASSPAVVRP